MGGSQRIPRVKGSKARLPSMMGVMRELLVRHQKCDYTKQVWVLAVRDPSSGAGELNESTHSQVRPELSLMSTLLNDRSAALLLHA